MYNSLTCEVYLTILMVSEFSGPSMCLPVLGLGSAYIARQQVPKTFTVRLVPKAMEKIIEIMCYKYLLVLKYNKFYPL
jgi:hypothetical protein